MARPRKNPTPSETNVELPEPAMSPFLGDLTPDYILWFKQTHSREEFIARYSERIPKEYPTTHQIDTE
jgi:hypothetical protein